MARAWLGLLLVGVASWAQEPSYKGRTAAEWVERLAHGDGAAAEAVQAIGAPCVRLILDRLAASQVHEHRLIEAVHEMGAQAGPTLAEALKRGKVEIRLLALDFLLALRMEDCPAEAAESIPALLADDNPEVRIGVALRLCEFGFEDASALPPLLEALQAKEHRAWAASLLWRYPNEAARIVPPLIAVSRLTDARRPALASLWCFWEASQNARARILEASRSEDAVERRDAVPESDLALPAVVSFCLKAAGDPDESVRRKALETLRWRWMRARLGDNADAGLSHPRTEVRRLACETVAAGETRLLGAVLARLDDEDDEVRLAAVEAIARIGDKGPEVRRRLRELFVEPRSETGQRMAWTLIALDVEVEAAVALLADGWKALEVAAALGPRASAAAPALREMLDAVPSEAAQALYAVTGEVEAPLEALRDELERRNVFYRLAACQAVSRFGPDAAPLVPQLARLLADHDAEVRCDAATSLACIGAASKPAIPKLAEMLDDSDPSVRRHAAAALAWLDVDTPRVRELLGDVIEARDPDDGVTRVGALRHVWKRGAMPVEDVVERCRKLLDEHPIPILRLLGEIGPPAKAAIPDIEALVHDRLYEIRAAAVDAIRRIRPPG